MSYQQFADRTTTDQNSANDINQLKANIEAVKGGDGAAAPTTTIETVNRNGVYSNAIINPDGEIGQRGTSFDSTTTPANDDGEYLLDRYVLLSDGNDVLDVSFDSTEKAIKWDVETSAQAGFLQVIENKNSRHLVGQKASISFKAKSNNITAIRAAIISWDSTADTVTLDVVSSWGATPTLVSNWTYENTPSDKTVTSDYTTIKIEDIDIDTAGTNNIGLFVWLPNAETIGDVIYIKNIQLNIGSSALDYSPRHFHEELMLCQRYFEKSYDYDEAFGTSPGHGYYEMRIRDVNSASYYQGATIFYKVVKRTTPTITTYSTSGTIDKVFMSVADRDSNETDVSEKSFVEQPTETTASIHRLVQFHWVADAEL